MKLLSGRELAEFIKERQAQEVRHLKQEFDVVPRLTIVATGDNSLNQTYMKLKQRYGEDIGVMVEAHRPHRNDVLSLIEKLNRDETIHGIIIQLPLADPTQTEAALNQVAPSKDIDGLGANATLDPATPTAIMWLLAGYHIDLKGKQVAVVGQGRLVGAPLERILKASRVNVTTFDEHSEDLTEKLPGMDVIISATGQPGLITPELVKSGAVVVDAGTSSEGGQIRGDAADALYQRQDISITPQKGGVGPLTVAALFDNLLRATRAIVAGP